MIPYKPDLFPVAPSSAIVFLRPQLYTSSFCSTAFISSFITFRFPLSHLPLPSMKPIMRVSTLAVAFLAQAACLVSAAPLAAPVADAALEARALSCSNYPGRVPGQ